MLDAQLGIWRGKIQTFTDPNDLAAAIRERGKTITQMIVGVDGVKGAGKSTLAKKLAQHLASTLIPLDSLLVDVAVSYAEGINTANLKERISVSAAGERTVVVEGLCLLTVLERIGITPDIHVYVLRVSADGRRCDEELFSEERSEEELLDEISALARQINIGDGEPLLERDSVRYHKRVRPLERADYCYKVAVRESYGV